MKPVHRIFGPVMKPQGTMMAVSYQHPAKGTCLRNTRPLVQSTGVWIVQTIGRRADGAPTSTVSCFRQRRHAQAWYDTISKERTP